MAYRNLTALYDTASEAQRAVESLVSAGISRSNIRTIDNAGSGGSSGLGGSAATTQYQTSSSSAGAGYDAGGGGFWQSLKDLFLPDDESHTYAEGVRRGGTLLSVSVDDTQIDSALDVIERSGAVDIDTRESEWKSSGSAGEGRTHGAFPASAVAGTELDRGAGAGMTGGMGRTGMTSGSSTDAYARGTSGDTEVIPVVEEELQVGKREVERGSVRVRSYIVERPISEMVTLRDETVTVERRSVDLPVSELGADAFRERTIEVTERDEEAVVAKTARVKEELVIRKDVEQQTETISDTVRHTEVEVEDTRTTGSSTTSGTSTTRGTTGNRS